MRSSVGLLVLTAACGADVRVTDGDASGGAANVGGDGGDGANAPSFSVWPGQTFSTVNCLDDGPQLFIEIWPAPANAEACVASPAIDPGQVLVIAIDKWDYSPGLFAMQSGMLHGTAHAAYAGSPEHAAGSITLEPFTEVPGIISWDLDFAQGNTDLSLCFRPPEVPCPAPDG
jgi:hypothetical protein